MAALAIAAVAPAAADARYKASLDTSSTSPHATFTEASSTPNAADLLVLREDGTKMRHNRKALGDSQFASGLDFDTSQPGNQYVSSDFPPTPATIEVRTGGGADAVRLGVPGFGKFQIAPNVLVRGEGGDDHVVIDNSGDIFTRFIDLFSHELSGVGTGVVNYTGIERLTYMGGDAVDWLEVVSTPGVTNLITRGGGDRFIPYPGASLKGGFFAAGAGTDVIDYTQRGSGSANLTAQRYFEAFLDGGQETPAPSPVSPALGYGAIRINPSTDVFDVDLIAVGLTGGNIAASHIHRGASGVAGPVIFDLGVVAWVPASPTAHSSLAKVDRFDPDTNPLNDVNTATLSQMPSQRYFNVHNSAYPNGEIRGQILDPNTTAGPASATKFAASVETVIPAP